MDLFNPQSCFLASLAAEWSLWCSDMKKSLTSKCRSNDWVQTGPMRFNFSILGLFIVRTVLGSSRRCWCSGRRAKGWQPRRTAPALTKEALWKEKREREEAKVPHIAPACFLKPTLSAAVSVPPADQRMSDKPEPAAIFITETLRLSYAFFFPFQHVLLCALCAAAYKSPALALSLTFSGHIFMTFTYTLSTTFVLSIVFDILPCILLLDSPLTPDFLTPF